MSASTHTLMVPGPMLVRGLWLYVWKINSPVGILLYVGRTGDSSSPKAAAPFRRMGQHLGTNANNNMIRRYLEIRGILPERCVLFELVAYGPIFPEAQNWPEHVELRDKVAALEMELAKTLEGVGYDVLNTVHSKHESDADLWTQVHDAFAVHFPRLD